MQPTFSEGGTYSLENGIEGIPAFLKLCIQITKVSHDKANNTD